jgi:hypothetical protein
LKKQQHTNKHLAKISKALSKKTTYSFLKHNGATGALMKLSTLIITSAMTLGISSAALASHKDKLCTYSCMPDTANDNYICAEVISSSEHNENHKLTSRLRFINKPFSKEYTVFYGDISYDDAHCTDNNICSVHINSKVSKCDLIAFEK